MKKLLISIFSICLCAVCAFGFIGCKPQDYGATTTDLTKVTANGGAAAVYDGNLYFVNGNLDNDGNNNGGKTLGSVYKVAIDEDGTIAENATYTKVVDSLVGYKNGSITIIGNSLYYAMPGNGKNSRGETLYNKVKFMRVNLDNGAVQELYTTEKNEESAEVEYAYYVQNEKVYLAVYEKTDKTLKCFTIDGGANQNFVKTEVQSVAFADNLGASSNADGAEKYIFYTLNCKEDAVDTNTNRLYRISPNGQNETLLIDDVTVSLEGVYQNKLILSVEYGTSPNNVTEVYALDVDANTTSDTYSLATSNSKIANPEALKYVISNKDYDNVVYQTNGTRISTLFADNSTLRYEYFENDPTTAKISYYITLSGAPKSFVGTYEYDGHTYLVYVDSNSAVCKIRVDYASQAEVDSEKPQSITLTKTSAQDANGNMLPKIIGNYVYFFGKKDSDVLMYRTNVLTPKEINDAKADDDPTKVEDNSKLVITEAEIVGGTSI